MLLSLSQRLYSRQTLLLLASACFQGWITCHYALARFYGGKTSLLDIGTFDQVLWNIVHHGVALSTTNAPFHDQNWFGFHFSPVLLLLVPFYSLWPHPELLQIVQSACFALAGIALFHALKAAGAAAKEAWAGALLYWCNPFVFSAAIWDFHEISIATLLMALALWAFCAGRFKPLVAFLALLLFTKEHYGISVAGFGFLWGWKYGQWQRGVTLMALGIAALLLIILVFMPVLNGGAAHPMLAQGATQLNRFSWLKMPFDVKINMFLHLMLSSQENLSGISYMFTLLLSGFMLPLAAPVYLLPAASDWMTNLLSANPMPRYVTAYHSAPIVPVVIVAAYRGYEKLRVAQEFFRNPVYKAISLLTLGFYCTNIVSIYRLWELDNPTPAFDRATVEQIERMVPAGGVSAQENIASFFSQRQAIYPFPFMSDSSRTVLLQLSRPFRSNRDRFGSPLGMSDQSYRAEVQGLLNDSKWHVAYWHAPWLMLLRGAGSDEASRKDILSYLDTAYPAGGK